MRDSYTGRYTSSALSKRGRKAQKFLANYRVKNRQESSIAGAGGASLQGTTKSELPAEAFVTCMKRGIAEYSKGIGAG